MPTVLAVCSAVLLVLGAWLTFLPRTRTGQLAVFAVGVATVALFALEWISNQFTDHGFDDSVVYHFRFGFEGAGIGEFKRMLTLDALVLTGALIGLAWALSKVPRFAARVPSWLGYALLTGAFVVHPTLPKLSRATYTAWFPAANKNGSLAKVDGFVKPQLPPHAGHILPNLVWIYAESLERTYFDEKLFPGLTPELKKLEQESLSFTNVGQVSGASWTIAGMVASQCGVPLVTAGAPKNSLGNAARFLPGADCLGDMLKAQGYTLHYSGGAAQVFAGKGKFYRGHGFDSVQGRDEFAKRFPNEKAMTSWGLYDATLFNHIREEFAELLAAKKPFGLFTLTLDTHGMAGHSCNNEIYGNGNIDILNAVHCSDRLISGLVRDLQRLDTSGNTLFLVTSDHIARPNNAQSLLQQGQRRNLALYFWPTRIKPESTDEPVSTLDTGVTALRLMGFPVQALAFGRAWHGGMPSLAAAPNLEVRMQEAIPNLLTLWNLPEHLDTLRVNAPQGLAVLNGEQRALPLIVGLRANGNIQKLFTPDGSGKIATRAELMALTDDCAEMKWIERCETVSKTLSRNVGGPGSWCIWDWKSDAVTPLATTQTIIK